MKSNIILKKTLCISVFYPSLRIYNVTRSYFVSYDIPTDQYNIWDHLNQSVISNTYNFTETYVKYYPIEFELYYYMRQLQPGHLHDTFIDVIFISVLFKTVIIFDRDHAIVRAIGFIVF